VKTDRAITPELVREHGLNEEEYAKLLASLGHRPNLVELGVYSAMWSEHCSYKSSRKLLGTLPTAGPRVLIGPGENAGVVDIGHGLAVAFKMESHNHPSFIEPYQGAATGVGGILRDVFTMGARPIASLNVLRFGDPKNPKTAHLLQGVIAGIGGYGNSIGVPTVGGEIAFDSSYDGNCLVNAFTLGVLPSDRIFLGKAVGVGNPVLYVGARTGRDGIHGATMASAEFGGDSDEKRPTVQVGDPFTEKLLLEACLELMRGDALLGIQDMGAAGLTSSSVEMAGRAGNGIRLHLDRVPTRETEMTPYEIMLSESQERMLMVVAQGREQEVEGVFRKWDLEAAVVGEVTDDGRLTLVFHGEQIASLPVEPLTADAPRYDRPRQRPAGLEALWTFDPATLPRRSVGETLLTLLARPGIASKEWVYRQYDHQVLAGTVIAPGADAAVVRIDGGSLGLGLSAGCHSRFCALDPYEGARLTVAEVCRNLALVGAEPIGITDCLNFGNPEKPEIAWQLAEAVRGLGDACRALEVPIVSGNVSLYNESFGRSIMPTPALAAVGLLEDVSVAIPSWFGKTGDTIALLGRCTGEIGGSELLASQGLMAGRPPRLSDDLERSVQRACRALVQARLLRSAHDCSDGGLAVALAEACVMGNKRLGARVDLPAVTSRPDLDAFSEEPSRVVISYDPASEAQLAEICRKHGAPLVRLGTVGGESLDFGPQGRVPLADLADAWHSGLQRALAL
jgi:phosphoribosylformylglycinamidine synthase subunit PurL